MLVTWVIVVVVVVSAWWYSRWRHSYWSSRGVSTPPYLPFLGHLHKIFGFNSQRHEHIHKSYIAFRNKGVFGVYEGFRPSLIVCDPELLKQIMVKDFDHFADRRSIGGEEKGSLFGEMMANRNGEEWKILRSILTPAFSSGKMRRMYPLVCQQADILIAACLRDDGNTPSLDMKDRFGRYTMDTIASVFFGFECNSHAKKEKSVFAQQAENFFHAPPLKALRISTMFMFPKLYKALGLKVDSEEIMFFRSVVEETIRTRVESPARGDFLDMVLETRAGEGKDSTPTAKHVLQDKVVVAQCVMFLIAGFDTTATALTLTSYLLAKHPHHQHRLRQELQGLARENGEPAYQEVMEAKYLDACVSEALRLFPPGTLGERLCTKPCKIQGTDLTMRVGDLLQIPIWSLHHDPQYWPQPYMFDPERFSPENKAKIQNFTYLPFGMGPRNCLAMRFALMETKVALAKMILMCELSLPPGQQELQVENSPIVLRPKGSVQIIVSPVENLENRE